MWISTIKTRFRCPECGKEEEIYESLKLLLVIDRLHEELAIKLCATCNSRRMEIVDIVCNVVKPEFLEALSHAFI